MKSSLCLSATAIALTAFSAPAWAQDTEDEIFVSGSPLDQTVEDALVGVSSLDGEELARNVSGTIGETLRREPGVSSTFFGAGASRPIIRGQGGDRIRVLSNGIGSIDASSASPDHAVAVEPALAERVEIVRGTSILRYGSSGAGGVVNVLDGRLPMEAPEDGLDGAIRFGGTTVDSGEEVAGGVTATLLEDNDLQIVGHVSGTWRDADNYDIPGFAESAAFIAQEEAEGGEEGEEEEEEVRDTLPNSYVEADSVAGGISFIGSNGFLSFSVKDSNTTYGIPGGHGHEEGEEEGEEEEEEGEVFIDLEQTRYDVNARFNINNSFFEALTIHGGYADYGHIEFEGPGEPGTVFSNEGWEARFELLQREHGNMRGAYGLQFRQRDFSAIGEEAFVPPTETEQFGIYTFQEYNNGPWHFEGALRYENTDHQNSVDGVELSFNGVSASIGGQYSQDNYSIAATVFRTERAPTTEELFSNGPHLATDQFEVGDLTLDEEVATGAEIIVRLGNDKASLTVNGFYTDYSDYIFEAATGAEEDGLPVFQFQAEDATFAGFEIEGQALLGAFAGFDISSDIVLDYVDASIDVTGNDNLPRIPPFGATFGIDADCEILGLRAEVEYAAEQDEVTTFELPTDSYTLVNLYADWRPFDSKDITLSAALLNASDEEARIHSSFLKDTVPLPGRNWRLSVRYAF